MKAIIIDDSTAAIETLADKLKKYEDFQLVGTATNGNIGLNLANEVCPDVMFLDIELPDMSGVEFLEQINVTLNEHCQVVMYTGYPQYMLPAFRNNAFDFLLKPIDDKELDNIINRIRHTHNKHSAQTDVDGIIKQKSDNKLLFYTNSVDFRLVHIKDIGIFQYNHEIRVWEVVIAGRKTPIRLKRSVNNETLLGIDERFIQVSQRYVININYLLEVNDNKCQFYPPFDKIDYVKVGRLFRKKLIERFCSL